MTETADLLIIGGGVNGTGIARDAAGRGLKVVLCEKSDLAAGTSSASTKLIHGGLRYLEQYDFRLVRESLMEREVLLAAAPHIIWPLRFVLPHHAGLRPAWLLRLGLFIYDHLGGRKRLPPTRVARLGSDPVGAALRPEFSRGFEYSDCWVDDARLVVLNALDAHERGAAIMTHSEVRSARREKGDWVATVTGHDGRERQIHARALVNAAGPWVARMLNRITGNGRNQPTIRLVKGSHIVTARLYDGPHAYIFQNADGRIVFTIPYERDFTLIGTTDVTYSGDLDSIAVLPEEVAYLTQAVSEYLRQPVAADDVVWAYSGVRPLYDDGSRKASEVTRDYVLDLDAPDDGAPLLSIYGGKITTFRRLSEHALEKLAPALGVAAGAWTRGARLPGGDIEDADFDRFLASMSKVYDWLPDATLKRLSRAYGSRIERVLGSARSMADLGRDFGYGLTEAELDYLKGVEWAACAEDVLWRRSKLGLHMPQTAQDAVADWFARAA
ncbi:MAG: glycerol-3-phosphate dehydrogenase [Sphingomonadales bacterium]|nr:glycerol-3-phosphate dehydrogenase [Sphingomonadales bacterium]